MYPLDDTRIHPKQRFVNPFFRVLSHCTDYVPIFVHARQTVGYKKISLRRLLQKNVRSPKQMEIARFFLLLFQPLFEIPLGTVNGTTGIMCQNAILGHQRCDHGIRILIKHRVVSHTKSDLNVEIGVLFVQKLCLCDGVAHGLKFAGVDLDLFRDAHFFFGDATGLTDDRYHLKPLRTEQVGHDAGFLSQTFAECKTQLVVAHPLAELHRLLQAGPLTVAKPLNGRTVDVEIVILGQIVAGAAASITEAFRIGQFLGIFSGSLLAQARTVQFAQVYTVLSSLIL